MQVERALYQVAINGTKRSDIRVASHRMVCGVEPSELVLSVPRAVFNQNIVRVGDFVNCIMWRKGDKQLVRKFYGQVININDTYSMAMGLNIVCKDMRHTLHRDVIRRNYNQEHPATGLTEERPRDKSVAQIVQDIVYFFKLRNLAAHPEYSYLQIAADNLPTDIKIGPQQFIGRTVAEVLDVVVNEYMDGLYYWVLEYEEDWTPVLRLHSYDVEGDSVIDYAYGTDPVVSRHDQAYGTPSTELIDNVESGEQIETRVVMLGDNVLEQRLVKLTPSWYWPRNRNSYVIEGEYFYNVTENNPKKLSYPEIVAAFLGNQDQFLKPNVQANRITNQNYTPEMDSIGKKFRISPLLMWDEQKYEDQDIIDATPQYKAVYMANQGDIADGSLPANMLDYCTYQVPVIKGDLLTLPLPSPEFDNGDYDIPAAPSSVFMIYRYYLDVLLANRIAFLATLYAANPLDPFLNWHTLTEGITVKNDTVMTDERIYRNTSILEIMVGFPSIAAGAAIDTHAKYVDAFSRQLSMEGCMWDAPNEAGDLPFGGSGAAGTREYIDGVLIFDITWKDIVKLFDDLYSYPNASDPVSRTGNHFLRYYATQPDMWAQDFESKYVHILWLKGLIRMQGYGHNFGMRLKILMTG